MIHVLDLLIGYVAGCVATYLVAVRPVERRQLALIAQSRRPQTDFTKTLPEIEIQLDEPRP